MFLTRACTLCHLTPPTDRRKLCGTCCPTAQSVFVYRDLPVPRRHDGSTLVSLSTLVVLDMLAMQLESTPTVSGSSTDRPRLGGTCLAKPYCKRDQCVPVLLCFNMMDFAQPLDIERVWNTPNALQDYTTLYNMVSLTTLYKTTRTRIL